MYGEWTYEGGENTGNGQYYPTASAAVTPAERMMVRAEWALLRQCGWYRRFVFSICPMEEFPWDRFF